MGPKMSYSTAEATSVSVTDDSPESQEIRALNALLKSIRNAHRVIAREQDPKALLREVAGGLVSGGHFRLVQLVTLGRTGKLEDWVDAGIATPVSAEMVLSKALGRYNPDAKYADNFAISLSVVGELFDCPLHGYVIRPDGLAAFSMPILSRGQLCGFFCAAFPRTALNSSEQIELFQELANDIAHALASLEQQRENLRLATAIQQCREAVIITDAANLIEYVNPAFTEITGYSAEEAFRKNPSMLKSGYQDRAFYARMWNRLTRGEVWEGILHNRAKDGSIFVEEAIITPIRNERGECTGYVGIKRDTTERTKWESTLQNAHKLQAVGTMASGLAHDFNNLLTGILGNLSFLKKYELESDHPGHESVDGTLLAVQRARQLVEQLLIFSRPHSDSTDTVDALAIAQEVIEFFRKSTPPKVEFQLDRQTQSTKFRGHSSKFHQVLVNLVTNAIHALPESGGTVCVRLSEDTVPTKLIESGGSSLPSDSFLVVSVSDNGSGMSPAVRERVFEPFYTTREEASGSGLGLAVVHSIISTFNGYIRLESAEGVGSTFYLYLQPGDSADCDADAFRT